MAIPNGGARNVVTAARLKAEGVSAGVPDLFIPAWNCWVEMKTASGGQVSKAQKAWHEYLTGIGHTVIIGRGFNDAADSIVKFCLRHDVNMYDGSQDGVGPLLEG